MYYHAKVHYAGKDHYWWDFSKEWIINNLLIPFVNGQVVLINKGNNILNMKSVSLLRVYKTSDKISLGNLGPDVPSLMVEPDFDTFTCTKELINEVRQGNSDLRSTSLLQKAFAVPKRQVFVIMKFGDKHLDSAYQGVIKPVIEEFNLKAVRIDEVQDSGSITDQVLENIALSQYVIADLSKERPNCYYEAGFAHALGKQLILMIRNEDTIHFDLAGYRFIQWETEAELRLALRNRLNSLESVG